MLMTRHSPVTNKALHQVDKFQSPEALQFQIKKKKVSAVSDDHNTAASQFTT